MGNLISLPALLLREFESVNSFFGTRQAVKWLWMLLPAHICCVEAYKNNHPPLASEIILAKPRICMKLCQWKSATASISLAEAILGRWRHAGGRGLPSADVPVRRRRSGRAWCCQACHRHHHGNTGCSICPPQVFPSTHRPTHLVLPTVPPRCARNNRLGWLFSCGTTGCSGQGHGHLIDNPKQPQLMLSESAVITFAISWPSSLLPLYFFSPPK